MSPPAATAAARRVHAEAAPLRLPPAPRRVSGPNRHPRAAVAARPQAASSPFIRLIDHPWLERLVRGRAWIAIVATALLGIVAMQVALLRLGAQIGSATSAVNALEQSNETTQTAIGALEAAGRGGSAAQAGMVYPAPGSLTYLQVNPDDAARAARAMRAPSPAAVLAARAHPPTSAGPPTATSPAATTPAVATTTVGAPITATTTTGATTTGGAAGSSSTTAAANTITPPSTSTTAASTGTSSAPPTSTGGASTAPTTTTATTSAGGTTPAAGTTTGG